MDLGIVEIDVSVLQMEGYANIAIWFLIIPMQLLIVIEVAFCQKKIL